MDIRHSTPQPGALGTDLAIPGLDIDPPHLEQDESGKPVLDRGRRQDQESNEGLGGWIGSMVRRSRKGSSVAGRGQYGRVGQEEA